MIGKWYLIRFFDFVICRRDHRLKVKEHGRKATYEMVMKVRSRRATLTTVPMRLRWSGESRLSECYESVGDGFQVVVVPECDALSKETGWDLVTFTFDEPLKRWRTGSVGVKFKLDEPNRKYLPIITYDTAAHAHSVFSRLGWRLQWDKTAPLRDASIEVREYRNEIHKKLHRLPPLRRWGFGELIRSGNSNEASWSLWAVPLARYYEMNSQFHPIDTPAPTSGARVIVLNDLSDVERGA